MKNSSFATAFTIGIGVLLSGCGGAEVGSTSFPVVAVSDANGAPLGSVAMPPECGSEAMAHVNRGVALLHNMTYTQAEGEFRSAAEIEAGCALAYWGMAMSSVHPLWPDAPSDEVLERGASLLADARAHGPLSETVEAYVAAVEGYYRDGPQRSESDRLAGYAEGWTQAFERDPLDVEAKLFSALGSLAVAVGSETRVADQTQAGQRAEAVLAEIPDHPGALHYIIHAYDLPDLADRGVPAAESYGEFVPENSHALHMTSHIFTRVGDWEESIEYNRRAADAGLANPINGQTSFHYLHAADYLVYGFLQRLDDAGAVGVWDGMVGRADGVFDHPASLYAFAAVPARIALERGDWETASALQSRWPAALSWDGAPHLVAITEFAKGLGGARTGKPGTAEAAVSNLEQLALEAAALPGPYDWGTQVDIQVLALRAWIAHEAGQAEEGLALMNQARELEATTQKNPVTPGEVLPAAELLGDMLMALDQPEPALEAYQSALERSPNRLNSLYGAARAAEVSGDPASARSYYEELVAGVDAEAEHEYLDHARQALGATN